MFAPASNKQAYINRRLNGQNFLTTQHSAADKQLSMEDTFDGKKDIQAKKYVEIHTHIQARRYVKILSYKHYI